MIQENIRAAMTAAMKSRETAKLEVLRAIQTAFTNKLVATKRTPQDILDDEEALAVISQLAKQRKDSIEQYTKGDRKDLADIESAELTILEEYLPQMMSDEDILAIAKKKKDELGIEDKSKIGMLIGSLMKDLKGKADGGDVKRMVESLFE